MTASIKTYASWKNRSRQRSTAGDPWKDLKEHFLILEWEIDLDVLEKVSEEVHKLHARYTDHPLSVLLGWMDRLTDARTNAINATNAAYDIYDVTRSLNEKIEEDSQSITVNMGINPGIALVGFTQFKGSLATRATYTASGPVTNRGLMQLKGIAQPVKAYSLVKGSCVFSPSTDQSIDSKSTFDS